MNEPTYHKQAFKDWGLILAPSFSIFDRAPFLLGSLIAISELYFDGKHNLSVVSIDRIPVEPKLRDQAIQVLKDRRFVRVENGQLILGIATGFSKVEYYFMDGVLDDNSIAETSERIGDIKDDPDFVEFLADLNTKFGKYEAYLNRVHKPELAAQLGAKLKKIINSVYTSGEFQPNELCVYLLCFTAMHNEYRDVPFMGITAKERGQAKNLIRIIDGRNMLKLVPFFLDNFPKLTPAIGTILGFKDKIIYEYNTKVKSRSGGAGDTLT